MKDWRHRAACKGMDTDLFYISKDAATPPDDLRRLCESCPVRHPCLLAALTNHEKGVWGGTTEKQRRTLRRNYRRRSCPACGGDVVPTLDEVQVCVSCGVSWTASKMRTADGVVLVRQHPDGET